MQTKALSAVYTRAVCDHLFVQAKACDSPALVFDPLPLENSSIPHWKRQLAAYAKSFQLYPPTIALCGNTFGLGTDFDEASRAQGVSKLYHLPPSLRKEDCLRDKVVLLLSAPAMLGQYFFEAGAFVALSGEGAEERASRFNWEACITLSQAYPGKDLASNIALSTGGFDLLVSYGERAFTQEEWMMAGILGSTMVHVGNVEEKGAHTLPLEDEEHIFQQVMLLVQKGDKK